MRVKMKEIYILLTDTGSVLTRLIKTYTHRPYNHVSLSFDPDLDTLYSFGRKNPNNPFFAGFVEESIYRGTFKKFKNTKCMVLKYAVSEFHYEQLQDNIHYFVENKQKYTYNFLGLLGAAVNMKVSRKNAYFCSEFVADVLYRSDLNIWDVPPHRVRPYDFGEDDRFDIIYEGLLRDLAFEKTLSKIEPKLD